MHKLIAQLRVKDGILFVHDWLACMDRLVDEIVVVDNGSTDGTFEILKSHPKVTRIEQTVGFEEGRDRIRILELAREQNADWHIWLDIDELFEDRITRENINRLMSQNKFTKFYFRRFNFHRDYNHFEARLDKLLEQSCWSRVMWKEDPNGFLPNRKIHVGNIQGVAGSGKFLMYRIKHLGSVDHSHYKRKTDIYIGVDPGRKDTYVKHRDQQLPTWRWFEYKENSTKVYIQITILNMFYPLALLIKKVRRIYLNKIVYDE